MKESNPESIAGALDHLTRMTDDEIAEMGRRGRRLVEQSICKAEGCRSDDGGL